MHGISSSFSLVSSFRHALRPPVLRQRLAVLCLAFLALPCLQGCSDGNDTISLDGEPEFLPVAVPTVQEPPAAGNPFLQQNTFDLSEAGYEAVEFFYEGNATAFTSLSELLGDGVWTVEPAEQAAYRSRILIHRPSDPARFNGTVHVEWLNVTAGFETPPVWGAGHVEMYREGQIWVGVSAQKIGVDGSAGALAPLHLKGVNPARYGSLLHPGDSFSYDMFSQVVPILRGEANVDVLAGMVPQRIIASGQSQSGGRMVAYINAVQPLYNAYDGFLVMTRGDGAAPLAQDPQVEIAAPEAVIVREDNRTPVLTVQSETDVTLLNYAAARQDDNDFFRLWEVAGTSHSDYYGIVAGRNDALGEPRFAAVVEEDTVFGFLQCDRPFNAGPFTYVLRAGLRALDAWVRDAVAPPVAPRLDLNDSQTAYLTDSLGNVTGGIRTPYVDAASAVLSGEGQTGGSFCFLFGTTSLFTADQMASLYVDEAGYVEAVAAAADAAVSAGFLLPVDAEAIVAWAPQQWRAQTGQ
ncbi:MAG: alpha/beta hydrolase domain-containing protein [Halieaceae bacterium]|nr:alpha/beta hydrolase domain-containing protein [Halieaceae bacterium]